jgi:hypothetical protein
MMKNIRDMITHSNEQTPMQVARAQGAVRDPWLLLVSGVGRAGSVHG